MKFGYFCNTTNWDHKPYDQLLNETKRSQLTVMKIIGTQFGIQNITLIMREWNLVRTH